jgi:hypothetical protein
VRDEQRTLGRNDILANVVDEAIRCLDNVAFWRSTARAERPLLAERRL